MLASCCDRGFASTPKPFWPNLLDTSDFPPRWHCGQWSPGLGWAHIVADLAIWGAYTAIPVVLCYFIRKRKDAPFPVIFWLFSVFILMCGLGHFVEATIFWMPWYRLSAVVKIGTALVSWVTLFALIPVLPKALALPGLAKVNQELQNEISERQRADEALRTAKESLEKKNRRLAELYQTAHKFVDNVSHEFRTPLTVIKEFSSIIRDGLAGKVNEEQREYLDIVVSRVDDLASMVEDMLDTSRLEAGVLGLSRTDSRVDQIIKHVRPTLQRKAASVKVALDIDIDDGLPEVYCDPEKIGRVLINLVVNALKVSKEKGRVKIWCRHDLDRSEVVIGVTDGGPGIAPVDLQVIFDRFKQIGRDACANTKGFGLGLNIARELVQLNFGDISVESELGKGSTFSFSVPTADRSALVRRYLERLAQSPDRSAAVSLVRVQTDAVDNADALEEVDEFLQNQLRSHDLLFRSHANELFVVAAADRQQLDQLMDRIRNALSESNRNRPDRPLPAIDLHPEGTWRIPLQSESCLQKLDSALAPGELAYA